MHHTCSECGRAVGLFVDNDGKPRQYRCPHTGRLAQPQTPVSRPTPPLTKVARDDVLQQLRLQGLKVEIER